MEDRACSVDPSKLETCDVGVWPAQLDPLQLGLGRMSFLAAVFRVVRPVAASSSRSRL